MGRIGNMNPILDETEQARQIHLDKQRVRWGKIDSIFKLRTEGRSLQEIAGQLGISRQRVDQVLNPAKADARTAVTSAIKSGKLTPSPVCERCGEVSETEAHHNDYSEPLIVEWLCNKCHVETRQNPNTNGGKPPKAYYPVIGYRLSKEERDRIQTVADAISCKLSDVIRECTKNYLPVIEQTLGIKTKHTPEVETNKNLCQ